jgi:hypothetical protein
MFVGKFGADGEIADAGFDGDTSAYVMLGR